MKAASSAAEEFFSDQTLARRKLTSHQFLYIILDYMLTWFSALVISPLLILTVLAALVSTQFGQLMQFCLGGSFPPTMNCTYQMILPNYLFVRKCKIFRISVRPKTFLSPRPSLACFRMPPISCANASNSLLFGFVRICSGGYPLLRAAVHLEPIYDGP